MSDQTRSTVFIVGCGDIGHRLGHLELSAGRRVIALARSDAAAAALSSGGFDIVRGDLDQPGSISRLPEHPSILYYLAPPPPTGLHDLRLASFLDTLGPDQFPRRCVYISTSGVYGNCAGAWVSEERPINPTTDRARRRAAAELTVRTWCEGRGIDFMLLRVPGIYGPGRLPIERIRKRIPVVCEEESPFSNRIHADDLASVCAAAAHFGQSGQAYNVSDGQPTTMTDYFYRIADFLGLPRPPAISMHEARKVLSPSMMSFLEESKRLDNRRMLADLGIRLRHPDLTSGLKSSL